MSAEGLFKQYRFAVQILFYDCEQFILRTIENCAPFVEKVYITYSPEPWSAYNKNARSLYGNPSNPDILNFSAYESKIELIAGNWESEEEQRNECLLKARSEGFDYLIIQDADEFYLQGEYLKNLQGIIDNPDHDYYRNPWLTFWKSTNYILLNRYPYYYMNGSWVKPYRSTILGFNACFAINCRTQVVFKDRRLPNSKNFLMLDGLCHHLSYVLNDEQMRLKLSTWGHSGQVNIEKWITLKWYGWHEVSRNLHPINHIEWIKAVKYYGKLPSEIKDFSPGIQLFVKPPAALRIVSFFSELFTHIKFWLKDLKLHIAKIS